MAEWNGQRRLPRVLSKILSVELRCHRTTNLNALNGGEIAGPGTQRNALQTHERSIDGRLRRTLRTANEHSFVLLKTEPVGFVELGADEEEEIVNEVILPHQGRLQPKLMHLPWQYGQTTAPTVRPSLQRECVTLTHLRNVRAGATCTCATTTPASQHALAPPPSLTWLKGIPRRG